MKLILLLLALISFSAVAVPFPAPGYRDGTEAIMKKYQDEGLELLAEKSIQGIQVKLHLAKSAKDAIAAGKFIVPDPAFNQEKFNAFIFDTFETSLTYFRQIDLNEELTELNLVLLDKGGDVGTISAATQWTRVLDLHLVRWHKSFIRKHMASYTNLSSIHEFGHVINYMYSPKEPKYYRELAAVFVECLHLIQLYGLESFQKTYLKTFPGKIADVNLVNDRKAANMPVIRTIAYTFFKKLYDGTYKGPAEPKKLSEDFVMTNLMSNTDEDAGLDEAFKKVGIALTADVLRADTIKDLTPASPAPSEL